MDCEKCSKNVSISNLNSLTALCVRIGNDWSWLFSNSSSGNTILNNNKLVVENQLFIQGNFNQSSGGETIFFVSNISSASSASFLNVSGCVDLQGDIVVLLETQPDEGNFLLNVISFSCSVAPSNNTNYNLQVETNYQNKSCHQISYSQNNQANSLSVSLNVRGCGVSRDLIIGLSVGLPLGLILIVIVALFVARSLSEREVNKFRANTNDMITMKRKKDVEDIWNECKLKENRFQYPIPFFHFFFFYLTPKKKYN